MFEPRIPRAPYLCRKCYRCDKTRKIISPVRSAIINAVCLQGQSRTQVATAHGLTRDTVNSVIKHFLRTGRTHSLRRGGRRDRVGKKKRQLQRALPLLSAHQPKV